MDTALLPETLSLAEQVRSLLATVECLRHEVAELRVENAGLRQEVRELRCDVGYNHPFRRRNAADNNLTSQHLSAEITRNCQFARKWLM